MSQENLEKKIIDELKRFSAPEPDPIFERRLREQFLRKIEHKHRSRNLLQVAKWVSSAAALIAIAILLYKSDLVGSDHKLSSDHNMLSEESMDKEATINVMQQETENKLEVSEIVKVVQPPIKKITERNLDFSKLEEGAYFSPNNGVWRFFRDSGYKKLYAASSENQGILLYESNDYEILTPHIYPYPSQPNQYLVWFDEQGTNKSIHHLLVVREDGDYREITGIPQQGFGGYQLKWSPSGEKAILAIENYEYSQFSIGIIDDQNFAYQQLVGEITKESTNPESMIGSANLLIANWENDSSLFLYNQGNKSLLRINLKKSSIPEERPLDSMIDDSIQVQDILPLPDVQSFLFLTGEKRLDVGFNDTKRLYLFNLKNDTFLPIDPQSKYRKFKNEQNYLGLAEKSQLILGEIIETTERIFQLRQIDPATIQETGSFTKAFAQSLSVQSAEISPDKSMAAVALLCEEYNTSGEFVRSFTQLLVVDLNSFNSIYEKEFPTVEQLTWSDHETLKYGEEEIKLKH